MIPKIIAHEGLIPNFFLYLLKKIMRILIIDRYYVYNNFKINT